ncbi:hypothetical protein SEA_MAKAI_70 [Arthrobacter phage Makai]|nr:hypothetical protein SEA_MAKAI_70 [Arthrobacter phage Makai]
MATFRKVEIVDAREFSGGITNGNSLVFWICSLQGLAEYHVGKDIPEHIRLYTHYATRQHELAYPGDWIERRQDGTFKVTRKQEIATYEEV